MNNFFILNHNAQRVIKHFSIIRSQVNNIDFSHFPFLEWVAIAWNPAISSIDVSASPYLYYFDAWRCDSLEYINIANGHNENLTLVWMNDCPNLQCVQVDEGFSPNPSPDYLWLIDDDSLLSYNCFMGAEDVKVEEAIDIYPNPVKDVLQIKSAFPIQEIRVYDMQAKMVKSFTSKESIALQDLPVGVYLIQVQTEKGVYTEKIIKE